MTQTHGVSQMVFFGGGAMPRGGKNVQKSFLMRERKRERDRERGG